MCLSLSVGLLDLTKFMATMLSHHRDVGNSLLNSKLSQIEVTYLATLATDTYEIKDAPIELIATMGCESL